GRVQEEARAIDVDLDLADVQRDALKDVRDRGRGRVYACVIGTQRDAVQHHNLAEVERTDLRRHDERERGRVARLTWFRRMERAGRLEARALREVGAPTGADRGLDGADLRALGAVPGLRISDRALRDGREATHRAG